MKIKLKLSPAEGGKKGYLKSKTGTDLKTKKLKTKKLKTKN